VLKNVRNTVEKEQEKDSSSQRDNFFTLYKIQKDAKTLFSHLFFVFLSR
jgi:hypothetical protein